LEDEIKALKSGESIKKPIYNHVNCTLDTPEEVKPTPIVIIEGLHPWHDDRVKNLLDYTIYLDISDDVKLNWKIQRDMEERGHSLESIMASIEARKPDFDAYIAPQNAFSDICIEVPQLILTRSTRRLLRFVASRRRVLLTSTQLTSSTRDQPLNGLHLPPSFLLQNLE